VTQCASIILRRRTISARAPKARSAASCARAAPRTRLPSMSSLERERERKRGRGREGEGEGEGGRQRERGTGRASEQEDAPAIYELLGRLIGVELGLDLV
jgi:hypothetical protein